MPEGTEAAPPVDIFTSLWKPVSVTPEQHLQICKYVLTGVLLTGGQLGTAAMLKLQSLGAAYMVAVAACLRSEDVRAIMTSQMCMKQQTNIGAIYIYTNVYMDIYILISRILMHTAPVLPTPKPTYGTYRTRVISEHFY